jgi:hypothetical protein
MREIPAASSLPAALVFAAMLVAGCRGSGTRGTSSELVPITGTSVRAGFARGVIRRDRAVDSFSISKVPVSWKEFNACVASGQCAKADQTSCSKAGFAPYPAYNGLPYSEQSDDSPATCVGEAQAEAYCRSVGGHLPNLEQWLLAARGASPQRFAWGATPTSCDVHPLAGQLILHRDRQSAACPGAQDTPTVAGLTIGMHPAGASPFGVEDVLLTPGELIAGDEGTFFNPCSKKGDHCVVYGQEPGAIDSVEPFLKLPPTEKASTTATAFAVHAYGFRCVVGSN